MGEAMAADSSYKKKLNEENLQLELKDLNAYTMPLCNTQVHAPAFLFLRLRGEEVFLQLDLYKNQMA